MIDWVIYYSDGRRITSADLCSVTDLPTTGVQIVLVRDGRCNRRVLKFADYYVWSPTLNRWLDCYDSAAVIVRAIKEPWIKVLAGEYLRESDFEKILIRANRDDDLKGITPDSLPHSAWKKDF